MRALVRARALIAFALLVCVACKQEVPVRHDEELKRTLASIRAAIAAFQKENGRYPSALQELAPKYLPRIPVDPVTKSNATWQFVTEETVQPNSDFTTAKSEAPKTVILDVRSGAGAPYSTY